MAAPNSRQTHIDYCKRRLGFPVVEINVDDEQVEDRIDEALQFFFEYHFDGVEENVFVHTVTDTDVTNGYITLTDNFFAIIGVSPISTFSAGSGGTLLNIPYQMHLSDFYSGGGFFSSGNLSYFDQIKSQSALLDQLYNPDKNFNFNRKTNKLFLEQDMQAVQNETPNLIIKAYVTIDQATYTEVWDDMFLKKYSTALIKKQWGQNLKKFSGVTLPGGVSFNGDDIFNEALTEIEALEFDARNNLQLPINFQVG